jgi:hypothetical protein
MTLHLFIWFERFNGKSEHAALSHVAMEKDKPQRVCAAGALQCKNANSRF